MYTHIKTHEKVNFKYVLLIGYKLHLNKAAKITIKIHAD
jgi:hypothetical protein